MSDAQTAPVLPLFFKRVVGVNPNLHAGLRLDRSAGYGFSAQAQSVPLGLGEFEAASQHYPILFTTGPNPTPVALLGLAEASNLFLLPDGATWRQGAYIPAYVRAFPFIFVEDASTKTVYVGMEPDAACLSTDSGAPLFEDDKPTAALNEAIAFCSTFRDNMAAAAAFARALDAQGLLEEEEATVNFTSGGSTRIRGFKILRADRLDQVSDETFLDWRRRGWLGALYAHLHSTARWARLIELAAAARPPAAA
ncbi:SapC family protein [Limobrevibacterium gyesilva]|uniref:SapC family protein n=1 Tax=Limobrevibacterium gyesilva TaxID=2991712 RepID=A0AA42CFF1_9PROT|nr:SapC family protein [Limobrevibacterium gyesilva]MCW3476539.1 SapC family protein [Limobrevibacterium gyesilva]